MSKKFVANVRNPLSSAIFRLITAAVFILGIAGTVLPVGVHAAARAPAHEGFAARKTNQPIGLMRKDGSQEWKVELQTPVISSNGRLYVSVPDLRTLFRDASLISSNDGALVTLAYPGALAEYRRDARQATVNGRSVRLDGAGLIVRQKTAYLAIREIASLLHADARYDAARRLLVVAYAERYLTEYGNDDAPALIWLDGRTRQLYTARPGERPEAAGTTNVKLNGAGYAVTERLDAQTIAVTVTDTYGEPSLGTNVYKLILHQGKLTLQSKAEYYGVRRTDSVFRYAGGIALVDGGRVLLAKPDGSVKQAADVRKMLDTEDAITVVYAADDALVVRLYLDQMLALVNLKTKTAVLLYKQLLPADERKRIEEASRYAMDFDYNGDGFEFDRREGDAFYFTHDDEEGNGESPYSLKLN
ncbi:hypothetical protein [Paenibacillus glycinis]|uniref:Copper amine oxidase-like N-terminal domain-containing protein n=1 Tax=Paenibacillus glycinis TaxID=2697035 RepID=A0ABW9XV12_9BACL|nr:hypothetical protein [Paenibacillus glycinis]NBD26521.1 hypothetical protein [Paenibacillus glycinis]